jgi:hypothetical protein
LESDDDDDEDDDAAGLMTVVDLAVVDLAVVDLVGAGLAATLDLVVDLATGLAAGFGLAVARGGVFYTLGAGFPFLPEAAGLFVDLATETPTPFVVARRHHRRQNCSGCVPR